MKTIQLVRYGDLNLVNHKKAYKFDTFHSPPLRKGIYAFHPNWIEPFLYKWKEKDGKKIKQKKFNYSGKIWTHMYHVHPEIKYYRNVKSWYETDTDSLEKIFAIEKVELAKGVNNAFRRIGQGLQWTRHAEKWSSIDHLELFIGEKV